MDRMIAVEHMFVEKQPLCREQDRVRTGHFCQGMLPKVLFKGNGKGNVYMYWQEMVQKDNAHTSMHFGEG